MQLEQGCGTVEYSHPQITRQLLHCVTVFPEPTLDAGSLAQWEDLASLYPSNKLVCNGIQTDRRCSAAPNMTARGPDGNLGTQYPNE